MKIICVGRNYVAHAKELGNETPTEPVIFLKPDSAILNAKEPFFIPDFSDDIHYEGELVVRINRIGKHIEERFAHKYYDEITVGIDFTARDLQAKLKEKGLPWELAKGFDRSAVLGQWHNKSNFDLKNLHFYLHKNGVEVQHGETSLMLFSIDKIIAFVSRYFTLKIGDVIYTGTPAGVGKVMPGDLLSGKLEGLDCFEIKVR
jgi:2-keto-4-pentenoate hydratase/2-oxohepta-3-ene-1,7-dioic acid hydratase in catechol pathway